MQNLNKKKKKCVLLKAKKTNLFCFRKEKYFLDGQSGSPLMFEVLYHSQRFWACLLLKSCLLVCGSLPKNNFLSSAKKIPSHFSFSSQKSSLCSRKKNLSLDLSSLYGSLLLYTYMSCLLFIWKVRLPQLCVAFPSIDRKSVV